MKNLTFGFVCLSLLIGFKAVAQAENSCPALTGNYHCSAFDGFFKVDIPVTQSDDKGVTTYVIDGGPIIADGERHHADKLPSLMAQFAENVNYTAVCNTTSVTFSGDGNEISSGENVQVIGTLTKVDESEVSLFISYTNSGGTNEATAKCLK